MTRKAVSDGGKRDKIIKSAQELFFERGFDGTSVRAIMARSKAEVGLFYYYFENKDEVFDKVLDSFFSGYEKNFADIVEHGRRNPCRIMADFFEYMERETEAFRKKYANNMHRTVRWAIREHTLTLIEPYLEQIVEIQSSYYGVPTAIAPKIAALYLTHGVGSAILHSDVKTYSQNRNEIKHGISLLMGMSSEEQELRIPVQAREADINSWMKFVDAVAEYFPGLDKAQYRQQLQRYIRNGEAWMFRKNGEIVAAALFSKEGCELDFLAVLPEYRRHRLARKLVETVAAQFPVGTVLSVVTYQGDDPLGRAARIIYEAMGFTPADNLTVFGYPCQRLCVILTDKPIGEK